MDNSKEASFMTRITEWLNQTQRRHVYAYFNSLTPAQRQWMGNRMGHRVREWMAKQDFQGVDEEAYNAMIDDQNKFNAKRKREKHASGKLGDWQERMHQMKGRRPTGEQDPEDVTGSPYDNNGGVTSPVRPQWDNWRRKTDKMKEKFNRWLKRQKEQTQPST